MAKFGVHLINPEMSGLLWFLGLLTSQPNRQRFSRYAMIYLSWLGATLFTLAAIPQVLKIWREGNAHGMSWGYLLPVWIGFWCMGIYTITTHAGMALTYSYGHQLVAFTAMIVRKQFPKR